MDYVRDSVIDCQVSDKLRSGQRSKLPMDPASCI
jgi:hypothetical protein